MFRDSPPSRSPSPGLLQRLEKEKAEGLALLLNRNSGSSPSITIPMTMLSDLRNSLKEAELRISSLESRLVKVEHLIYKATSSCPHVCDDLDSLDFLLLDELTLSHEEVLRKRLSTTPKRTSTISRSGFRQARRKVQGPISRPSLPSLKRGPLWETSPDVSQSPGSDTMEVSPLSSPSFDREPLRRQLIPQDGPNPPPSLRL